MFFIAVAAAAVSWGLTLVMYSMLSFALIYCLSFVFVFVKLSISAVVDAVAFVAAVFAVVAIVAVCSPASMSTSASSVQFQHFVNSPKC